MKTRKHNPQSRFIAAAWLFAGLLACLSVEASQRDACRDRACIIRIIHDGARDEGVHPLFAEAIARVESSLNPNAVSSTGCVGLMQLCRAAAKDAGVTDRFSPVQNVRGASWYVRQLIERYRRLGDDATCVALLAYFRGMAVADPVGSCAAVPAIGRRYISRVLNTFQQLRGEARAAGRVVDPSTRAGLDRAAHAGREAGLAGSVFDRGGTRGVPHRGGATHREALRRYALCVRGHLPPWECHQTVDRRGGMR